MWGCDMFKKSVLSSPTPTGSDIVSTGFDIQGKTEIIGKNKDVQFKLLVTLSDGTTQDQTAAAIWESSNIVVATVGTKSGLVTSKGYGEAQIMATYQNTKTSFALKVIPLTILLEAISDDMAIFKKDEIKFYEKYGYGGGGRGFNVAAISPTTGELIYPVKNFDTYASREDGKQMKAMIDFINSLPNGTLLLIAVADEAGLNTWPVGILPPYTSCTSKVNPYNEQGKQLLEALGSTMIRKYCYRYHWAMITIKGSGKLAEDYDNDYYQVTIKASLPIV